MLEMILTAKLSPHYRNAGFSLSEDADFLYLLKDGKVRGCFQPHRITFALLEDAMDEILKVERN